MNGQQRERAEQIAQEAIRKIEQQAYPLDVMIDALSLIVAKVRTRREQVQREYGLGFIRGIKNSAQRSTASGEYSLCDRCNSVGGYYIEDRYRHHSRQTWVTCPNCRGSGFTGEKQ